MDPQLNSLPFITRKMFNFEAGTKFSLQITSQAETGSIITIRGITREGPFIMSHTCVNTGEPTVESFGIADVPIFMSVTDDGMNFGQGALYATINLMMNDTLVAELCSGFVTGVRGISWPGGNNIDRMPGHGLTKYANSTNPAAGAEFSIAVPSYEIWKILGIRFQLVTDGTVANRRVHIVFTPETNLPIDFFASVDQTASQTINYSGAAYPAGLSEANDNDIKIALPQGFILGPQSTITSETTGLVAGDNFGIAKVYYEKFYTPLA